MLYQQDEIVRLKEETQKIWSKLGREKAAKSHDSVLEEHSDHKSISDASSVMFLKGLFKVEFMPFVFHRDWFLWKILFNIVIFRFSCLRQLYRMYGMKVKLIEKRNIFILLSLCIAVKNTAEINSQLMLSFHQMICD